MWIYFWWEVLSWEVHRAITEVAAEAHKHTSGRVGEVAGGFVADKHRIERQIVIRGTVKVNDNFQRVGGEWEKEAGSQPLLVETLRVLE